MIFSTGMEGGSFVMCEDLCAPPELSFEGAEGVLVGTTVPGGGGGNGPFCCAPRVTANKPVAIKSSGLAFMGTLAAPTASKVSPSISSSLLDFLFIVIHPRSSMHQLALSWLEFHFSQRDEELQGSRLI